MNTKKWILKENQSRIQRAKGQIEQDKKTLARKRSIFQLWQQPNGQELTNNDVEEMLLAKELEIEKAEEQEPSEQSYRLYQCYSITFNKCCCDFNCSLKLAP